MGSRSETANLITLYLSLAVKRMFLVFTFLLNSAVKGLQGSDGACKKTEVEVNNFSSQVVAGTMYEFDLVLDHAEDSAAECGAPDGLREVCHMAVWEKVWEDFREVQWDRSTCIRTGSN